MSQKKLNVHYFLELRQGLTYSRNRGITESKGEYLAFIDDDVFVEVDYIENINPDIIGSKTKIEFMKFSGILDEYIDFLKNEEIIN